jgi:hypothetical protein
MDTSTAEHVFVFFGNRIYIVHHVSRETQELWSPRLDVDTVLFVWRWIEAIPSTHGRMLLTPGSRHELCGYCTTDV